MNRSSWFPSFFFGVFMTLYFLIIAVGALSILAQGISHATMPLFLRILYVLGGSFILVVIGVVLLWFRQSMRSRS